MSTFPGYIPELPGIGIDRFDQPVLDRARVFFLSHCHMDHMTGLAANHPLPGTLYLSPHSAVIVGLRYPKQTVYRMPIRERLTLSITAPTGESTYELCVRTVPAEHCPGSVMFYFETKTVRLLYTGDFRHSSDSMAVIKQDHIRPEIVYLDTTFLDRDYMYFPTRQQSMSRIIALCTQWLEADQRNIVSLWPPATYGSEELFHQLYTHLHHRIHIYASQRATYNHFETLKDVFTDDPVGARVHACNGKTMQGEMPCRKENENAKYLLTIRPSARKWRNLQRDEPFWLEGRKNLWFVCYSSHASSTELVEFLRGLQPEARDIRFNVVEDETERIQMEHYLQSLLSPGDGCRMGEDAHDESEAMYTLPSIDFDANTSNEQPDDWGQSDREEESDESMSPPSKIAKRC
ncbi:protein artemis-like [Anopheles marshallii]|uniref:protein artemis-like n=1 Tax=Anopheles marshallii TaxID=1521116 RepID=UPI00237AD34C|nr:protein artemis-like [Anopheles marshallii]